MKDIFDLSQYFRWGALRKTAPITLLMVTFIVIPLAGQVDSRIFDGSGEEATEAEVEDSDQPVDPDARTGWNKDEEKPEKKEADAGDSGNGQKESQQKPPPGLPPPPEPAKSLPEPPEGKEAEEPESPTGEPSPGTVANPNPRAVSLDIALPFPSDI